MAMLPSTASILVAGIAAMLFAIYNAAKPKPIPGIPHVAVSAKRLLGDLPDALAYQAKTGEMISFIANKCEELNSPIVQVFMRPFHRPWVMISDPREAQDILARRTQDFDRSEFFRDVFQAIMPGQQVVLPMNQAWKSHRRLMADSMSPKFLRNVAGPRLYESFVQLMNFWHQKMCIVGDQPFDAKHDIGSAVFDAVFATALGLSPGVVARQSRAQKQMGKTSSFPRPSHVDVHDILTTVIESCEIPMKSPLGRLHHYLAVRFYPKLRNALQAKDKIFLEKVQAAGRKFSSGNVTEDEMYGVVDLLIAKELEMANRQGRPAIMESYEIREELFGFFVGAYDTTLTTAQWIVKYLTLNPEVQTKLRLELRKAFPQSVEKKTPPSAQEIIRTEIPYLDATVEELLRCSNTVMANSRVAVRDTEVLGYLIPKGTDIFMMTLYAGDQSIRIQTLTILKSAGGPGYQAPSVHVDESKRSKSSQATPYANLWSGNWREDELRLFKPERWLAVDDRGQVVFDARAGPRHLFGAGPRGCFGKKLARLALRMFVTLIVWSFELLELPGELNDMKARDVLLHTPQKVYARLQEVN